MLHSIHSPKYLKQQQGTVVLLTAVVLALIMGILALTAARTSLMEQKITGNDIRAREAREAAEAGLEFAMAWAGTQPITAALTCPGGTGCPNIPTITASTSGSTYSNTVVFTPDTNSKNFIKVVATAVGNDGSSAKAERWIKQLSLLNNETNFPPPFIINGTLEGVVGGPTIDTGNPPSTAFLTSGLVSNIETGHFNKNGPPLGDIVSANFTNAWNFVFKESLTYATNTAISNGYSASDNSNLPSVPGVGKKPYFYYNNTAKNAQFKGGKYGKPSNPVVIILAPGSCPEFKQTIIYGLIYAQNTCNDQAWAGAEIHGSVISDGSITKLNSNSQFYGLGNSGGGGDGLNIFLDYTTTIPGTWKDF